MSYKDSTPLYLTSKAYSWAAFIISNIVVEIPYQIFLGICVFASYYYPIYTSNGIQSSERQGLILLYCIQFFLFASTFAHMLISALPDAETAGNIATLMFSMTLLFNGVFQPPQALPGFWIFMYRVSPLTYFVGGVVSTGLHSRAVTCAQNELAIMQPINGQTCGAYLADYIQMAGGSVYNPNATSDCEFCSFNVADTYLNSVGIQWDQRWRNYGIG
jgi:ATP-binding cassette subfamily G (WHITE) protein 2 (PDR)